MKRAFTLIEALILVAVIAVIAVFLLPLFARVRSDPPRRTRCSTNLKQLGLAFSQYVQDYNGKLPSARVSPTTGWANAISAYAKDQQVYQCDKASLNSPSSFTVDYFYNRRLVPIASSKFRAPQSIILFGDGDDNAPTWNSWTGLPSDATTNSYSPSQRHLNNAAYYCFVDGHVKWLRPNEIPTPSLKPDGSAPTFAAR